MCVFVRDVPRSNYATPAKFFVFVSKLFNISLPFVMSSSIDFGTFNLFFTPSSVENQNETYSKSTSSTFSYTKCVINHIHVILWFAKEPKDRNL